MQHITAFSPPQTVPAAPAPAAGRKSSLWILDSWRDLILYVCTPLLLVPIFIGAQGIWAAEDIYLFVAAFGAMGHHLPGMIRAYGDRALFQRFRWRFICAPIFLVVVCAAFSVWDLKGIVLVAFMWGVWHGMMQTYGFCRIYDAKVGSFAEITRRLDFALCGIWFATAVLLSPQRMTDTLETYYSAGGPFIPPAILRAGQQGLLALALLVSAVFVANFLWMWSTGKRPSPVKLVLLVTSISFWWYCNNIVASVLVGVALFEVFHDVQYLSLVWIYNRKRVESDRSIGGFMRFVFRRSGALVGLYIGLIFAYGALGYYKSSIGIDVVKRMPSENALLLPRSRHFQEANCPDRYGHRGDLDRTATSAGIAQPPRPVCRVFQERHHSYSALAASSAPDGWPSHIQQPLRLCGRVGPGDTRSRNDIQRCSARSAMLVRNASVPHRVARSPSIESRG
jgi:hypothetical protein